MNRVVESLRELIQTQRRAGLNPAEFHMTTATLTTFVEDAGLKPEPAFDRRSMLERLRNTPEPPASYRFEGLPLVAADSLPLGAIIARPGVLMGDPDWLRRVTFSKSEEEAVQPSMPPQGTPWMENVPVDVAKGAEDDPVVTNEMLGRDSGVNPTSVLLKGMDGLDKVQDVVILRYFKDGGIDLCSTFNRYAVVGGLQAALQYIARGE